MRQCYLLSGQYQVGKSTFAKKLESLNNDSICIPLADGIRELILEKFDFLDKTILYSKPTPSHIRDLIKSLGNFLKKELNQDYWCVKVLDKFNLSNKSILIIDDLRFIHELDFFKEKFEIVTTIFIGESSKDYELMEIYKKSDIFLDKFPQIK